MLIIKIHNDGTGDVETGNYTYQVLVNNTLIDSGKFTGHIRSAGWRNLVDMMLDESENNQLEKIIDKISGKKVDS